MRDAEAEYQRRKLAVLIEAAAADLELNGPVSDAELRRILSAAEHDVEAEMATPATGALPR